MQSATDIYSDDTKTVKEKKDGKEITTISLSLSGENSIKDVIIVVKGNNDIGWVTVEY